MRRGLDLVVLIPVREASVWPMAKESRSGLSNGVIDQWSPNLNFLLTKRADIFEMVNDAENPPFAERERDWATDF
jgi:hypothetical protein